MYTNYTFIFPTRSDSKFLDTLFHKNEITIAHYQIEDTFDFNKHLWDVENLSA